MRRPLHRRPAAAAAALAALLLTLSACSSDGADAPPKAATPTRSAAVPDRQAEAEPAGPTPSASRGPVVPDSELQPVTGSFTQKEKEYLSGRVPQNTDPAAVLQTGQESCQRLERTAKRDRDAAVGAIVAGDIADAEAVVTHLCPAQKPLLVTASTGFPDGTVKEPKAGSYRALTTNPACAWRAVGEDGKILASGPATGSEGPVVAKIPAGAREFTSSACYAWLPA
ncbi:hypothetical protein [Streptomyces vilmorinianum]|uniref:hypothetical protein n=1 Tax=Streptomyces vilmorinianum TaxID=3051092 RepID=UPI0010FB7637|nr:hypothetical protein [Streptomyces vilmorinianum]